MKNQKRRDPIKVMLIWTIVLAVLAAGALLLGNVIRDYRTNLLANMQEEVKEINTQRDQEYAKAMAEFEASTQSGANLAWPAPNAEGWDVVDLTTYPLESPSMITLNRADIMNNGMLLVNQWHSRPDDFSEEALVSIGNHSSGDIPVKNYNLQLFPVAIDALKEALADAKAAGHENYMVDEAYRSWETQNTLFNKYMEQYSSRYSGNELIERTKRDVNYPGTSEFNSGLAFTLRLYKSGDSAVNSSTYVETEAGKWMNENCWRYGLVFRFPKADYPVKGTQDKSYKTGVAVSLDCYRYVGKAHAAVMHHLDLCLEEYVEYLQEHPHIAVFEDGTLRYEIVRRYVGDEVNPVEVEINTKAGTYVSNLDNMGAVVTVFEY
ncbi:MAG: D-alanyl-D-alanine carboxypeptidase family protein [Clostridiales bacterium]|nr:D-alanyl-D-alanine carboxypeptidase family protein [Clostridiales bacterium]